MKCIVNYTFNYLNVPIRFIQNQMFDLYILDAIPIMVKSISIKVVRYCIQESSNLKLEI